MTEERLSQLEALCQEATEGPWKVWNAYQNDLPVSYAGRVGPEADDGFCGIRATEWPAKDLSAPPGDLAFIATARTALPEALAEVRRLREALSSITETPELTSDRAIAIARRALSEEVRA